MKPATLAKACATHPPRTGASRQRGAVALVVGLLLPVLLGAVGLALDLSLIHI